MTDFYLVGGEGTSAGSEIAEITQGLGYPLRKINNGNEVYVDAGYGGIGLNSPFLMADVTASWQTISGWDTAIIGTPKYVVQDFANDGIRVQQVGVWSIDIKITLTFAEVNNGRSLQLRFFNNTASQQLGLPFTYFVARNQGGINLVLNFISDLDDTFLNDLIQLEIMSADGFTGVSNLGSYFNLVHSSDGAQ